MTNLLIAMTPKVSVIMPIYNTAAYLPQALDSICNQTLRELQIILVDDGSTDECPKILQRYANRDSRIEVLTQKNQGQGCARNNGLAYAKGEYLYFMDSDDILDTSCLAECYEHCKQECLDYVFFDAQILEEHQQNQHSFNYDRKHLIDYTQKLDSKEVLRQTLNNASFRSTIWLFFMRRDMVMQNHILFPIGVIHEDNAFVLELMLYSQWTRYIPIPAFHRRIRQCSTMTAPFSMRNIIGYVKVADHAKTTLRQHPEWKSLIELFLKKTFDSVIWQGHRLTWNEKLNTTKLFFQHSLIRYGSLKSWLAFWLKRS